MLRNMPSRVVLMIGLATVILASKQRACAREEYLAELTRLFSAQPDSEAAKTAARLKCRLCHSSEPPGREQNVFGREMERALGGKRNVTDRRSIRVALHRAVFLLRNRKPNTQAQIPGSSRAIGSRNVRTALRDKAELAAYEMPLSDVLGVLSANHGISIGLDQAAFKQAGVSPELPISLVVSDVSLQSLLKSLLAEHHLTFHAKGDGLLVDPEEQPSTKKPARNPVRLGKEEVIDPNLAATLKKYIGRRIQVVEKDGARLSDLLLKLHDKEGRLDGFSLFSSQSSSGKRYVVLSNVKEIRYRNQPLFCAWSPRIRSPSKAGGSKRKCSRGKEHAAGRVFRPPIAGRRASNGPPSRCETRAGDFRCLGGMRKNSARRPAWWARSGISPPIKPRKAGPLRRIPPQQKRAVPIGRPHPRRPNRCPIRRVPRWIESPSSFDM